MLRKVHINIALVEMLAHMPMYAKFFKDLMSNNKRLKEFKTITLNDEFSALITNKLPLKLRHSRSLTIPCTIGNL